MPQGRERGKQMAVTSRDIQRADTGTRTLTLPRRVGAVAYLVTTILAVAAIYVIVSAGVAWAQVRLDDLRYGRPRTMHVEGYVGHGTEAVGRPTRLIGLNLDRQVMVMVIPGGDASQMQTITGPYLFGSGEDLTPVLLYLQDMDRDGLADLIVAVRNEQIVYLNREGSFRLPTPDEQLKLLQEHGP
jgi:hypothetical protein